MDLEGDRLRDQSRSKQSLQVDTLLPINPANSIRNLPQRQSSNSSTSSDSTSISNDNSNSSQFSPLGSTDQPLRPARSPSSCGSAYSSNSTRILPITPPGSEVEVDSSLGMFSNGNGHGRGLGFRPSAESEVSRLSGVQSSSAAAGSTAGFTTSPSSKSNSSFYNLKMNGLGQAPEEFNEEQLSLGLRNVPSAPQLSAATTTPASYSSPNPSSNPSHSNSKSKNEIFAAPSPRITPAPRLSSSTFTPSSPSLSSNSSTPSKTGAFFSSSGCGGSWSSSSANRSSSPSRSLKSESRNHYSGLASTTPIPPPRLPLPSRRRSQSLTPTHDSPSSPSASTSNPEPQKSNQNQADSHQGHVRQRPSLGRQSTEEREKERARIRSSKEVEYRLRPTKEYCLGEGRHCNVFLGAWRRRRRAEESTSSSSSIEEESGRRNEASGSWSLCAVKRLHADRESNLLGLDEAFALRRLGPHPHVVQLIDIKDEVNIGDSESSYMGAGSYSIQKRLGKGYPSSTPISAGPEPISFATQLRLSTGGNSRNLVLSAPVRENQEKPFVQLKGGPALKVPTPHHARSTSENVKGRDDEISEDAFLGDSLTPSLAKKTVETLVQRSSSRLLAPEEEEAAVKLSQVNHRRFISQPVGENAIAIERKEAGSHLSSGKIDPPKVRVAAPSEERSRTAAQVSESRKVSSSSIETSATNSSTSTSTSSNGTAMIESTLPSAGVTFSVPTSPSPSATPLPTPQASTSSTPTQDPPRLLILLELLPFSLSTYARKNAEMIDLQLWMRWAKELSSTLAWMHEKGCVHADIKKENVLLTEDLSVKLCDFNSALFPNPLSPPTDGLGLGTPAYGAPELTRAFSSSNSSSPISFKIDIWSLGAVLYSLAVGTEPFSRARSMMDMMHRKRVFFQSEEDDRIARLSVENGWGGSNSNSASTSRNGSLRGRKVPRWEKKDTSSSNSLKSRYRREGSTDSLDSVSSSITNMTGGAPSIAAINALLNPDEEESLDSFSGDSQSTENLVPGWNVSNHHRTSSLGKAQSRNQALKTPTVAISSSTVNPANSSSNLGLNLNININSRLATPSRPTLLKRSTSYNDQAIEEKALQNATAQSVEAQERENGSLRSPPSQSTNLPPTSPGGSTSQLHRSVTAAFAQASRSQNKGLSTSENLSHPNPSDPNRRREFSNSSSSTSSSNYGFGTDASRDEIEEEEEILEREKLDSRSYQDGSPALVLPGGGRLPEAARNLLSRMLDVDPSRRPCAREVFEELEKISNELSETLLR